MNIISLWYMCLEQVDYYNHQWLKKKHFTKNMIELQISVPINGYNLISLEIYTSLKTSLVSMLTLYLLSY